MITDNMGTVNLFDFARYVGLSMLSQGMSVSPLKLQKILYYIQAWHMVFFGRTSQLFDEAPQAWVNGPVYPEIYHRYKNSAFNMCDHLTVASFGATEDTALSEVKALSDKMKLTPEQIDVIDSVIRLYGTKTQNQLIFVTHSEQPWCDARGDLLPYEPSNNTISLDTMYGYYKARRERRKARQ